MGYRPRRVKMPRASQVLFKAVDRFRGRVALPSLSLSEPLEKRQLLSVSAVAVRSDASKLDSSLTTLYENYLQTGTQNGTQTGAVTSAQSVSDDSDGTDSTGSLLEISNGSVELQSFAKAGQHSNLVAVLKRLKATGITGKTREVDAMVPISALGKLASAGSLRFAQAGIQVVNSGAVTSQGDSAVQADTARAAFSINGAGVKVGIVSDSFNTSAAATDKYANDVASGDLPSNVQVLADGLPTDTDEGRAIAQVIYDSAPGATLAFATAGSTLGTFANNIRSLASDGAKVIVDDVTNIYEPMFQDGAVAQAVTAVTASGVTYISAAGNRGTDAYASNWSAGSTFSAGAIPNAAGAPAFYGGTAFNFGTTQAPSNLNSFQLAAGASIKLSFQWDSPYYSVSGGSGTTNQLDAYVLNSAGTQIVGGSASYVVGADPIQVFQFTNTTGAAATYNLMLVNENIGATPTYLKYVDFGQSTNWTYAPNAGTIFGHANATGAETIGAVAYSNTPVYGGTLSLESYSGQGGTPILFNTAGGRLATPINRQEPSLVGPDGVFNTFYGTLQPGNTYPTFSGTSAAAASVAAVAALFIQKNPVITPAQVDTAMQNTAIHFPGATTPNSASGYGLVQAVAGISTFVANITGTVFHDNNANNSIDSGETGYGTVTVYIDSNNNGILDAGEPTTNTASNGTYSFYNQTAGSVVVRVVPPAGTVATSNGRAVTITAGVLTSGVNLGVFPIAFSGTAGGYNYTLQTDPTTSTNLDIITPTTTYTAPKTLIPSLSFNLGGGNNTLNVNFSSGSPVPLGGVIFLASNGTINNTLNLNGTSGSDNFSVYGATTFYNGSSGVTADNIQSEYVNGMGGNDLFSVEAAQPAAMSLLQFNGGVGNDTLTIDDILPNNGVGTNFNAGTNSSDINTLNVNVGTFTFAGNPASTAANLTVNLQNTANNANASSGVVFAAGPLNSGINVRSLAALNISPGTFNSDPDNPVPPPPPTVTVAAPASHADRAVLIVGSLNLSGASVVDLNANDMIITGGTSIATATAFLQAGYNGGAWNGGSGIESSAAAGDATHLTTLGSLVNNNGGTPFYGNGSALGLFDGQNPGLNSVLIKYTYFGDADLSGVVDASDYSRIDSAYLQGGTGWINGDFNYDGTINGSDYTLIDNAFNTQGPGL